MFIRMTLDRAPNLAPNCFLCFRDCHIIQNKPSACWYGLHNTEHNTHIDSRTSCRIDTLTSGRMSIFSGNFKKIMSSVFLAVFMLKLERELEILCFYLRLETFEPDLEPVAKYCSRYCSIFSKLAFLNHVSWRKISCAKFKAKLQTNSISTWQYPCKKCDFSGSEIEKIYEIFFFIVLCFCMNVFTSFLTLLAQILDFFVYKNSNKTKQVKFNDGNLCFFLGVFITYEHIRISVSFTFFLHFFHSIFIFGFHLK